MIYTIADIRALNPCYDPTYYVAEDWQGTAIDVLRVASCLPQDRLWVVMHWLDDRTLRLFAVWCARQALARLDNPDPRSVDACSVAEKFANGQANRLELAEAYGAARDAAWGAAWDTAWGAARDAVWAAQIQHLVEMLEEEQLIAYG